jgi:glutaconate CoA-transferase subunit B
MDFNGPNKQMRVVSLHPGVPLSEVLENTGFEVAVAPNMTETPAPSAEQLALITELDPLNVRSKQLKDNPPGMRNPN